MIAQAIKQALRITLQVVLICFLITAMFFLLTSCVSMNVNSDRPCVDGEAIIVIGGELKCTKVNKCQIEDKY